MFFEKPNVRYVDMCIYIDNNIYSGEYDQKTVFQYLYHIILMLTLKRDYFNNAKIREDFSIYAASIYYMRLTDERQFCNDSSIAPIKSILNYIRKTLYSIRREYVNKYSPELDTTTDSDFISLDNDAFSMYVCSKIDFTSKFEFDSYLSSVDTIVRDTLKTIPYKKSTSEWNNIYISCMLSFLNSITLSNKDIRRLNNFKRPNSLNDDLLNFLYQKERSNSTILFHLPNSMYNYITILTNKIRHRLSKDLSQVLHTQFPSCITMRNLLMSNTMEEDYR